MGVELHDPVPHDLQRHPADLGRLGAAAAPVDRLQMETLKPIFLGNDRAILMIDEALLPGTIHTLAQGVIGISYSVPEFGPYRRHLSIQKLRGVKFKEGLHDFEIITGGIVIYPRLVASEHRLGETADQISSGISAFDSILGGGLDRGTSTIFMGPAGSGNRSSWCKRWHRKSTAAIGPSRERANEKQN